MAPSDWKEEVGELIGYLKAIVTGGMEYLKLSIAERLAKVGSSILLLVIVLLLGAMIMIFLGIGLAFVLADYFNSLATGFFAVTGIYILLTLLVIVLRRVLILNPLLNQLLKKLTHEEDQ